MKELIKNEDGFTLFEFLLAIGWLSIMVIMLIVFFAVGKFALLYLVGQ